MSNSKTTTLSLLVFLLLAIISLVISAPTPGDESIFDQVQNFTARDANWVPGQPVNVWVSAGGRSIYYKLCEPKVDDQYMCTVSFAQYTENDWAGMWIFDNQCRQVGFHGQVTRDQLSRRFGLTSQLPMYTDVWVDRSWNPTWLSGVQVWYGAYNNRDPWLWAPQQWLPQLDKNILEAHDGSPRPWFVFRVPFLC
ncbi:hypothetical protein DL98DRAFT_653360 [Cadophora sp. DSE1049]|nr:hypothetical protein DL98DRAFT_653360 [Cadophora sp. DSE1049]